MTSEISKEEAARAISEEADDDDFKDAVEEEEVDGCFPVSREELSIIRAELACEYPEDYSYLSDSYILSVASKPYSKDPSVRRPLEYTMEKLKHVMQWREDEGAPDIFDLVALANGPESAPEALGNPEQLTKAKAMVYALNYASLYWHGLTKDGRPILWLRTNRKPWYPDVDAEVDALVAMADAGIKCMPEGITDFVCISESSSPPPPNPTFMIKMLKALVKGYPDRLNVLLSAPVSSIVQFVMNLLLPLMPGRLASKVVLLDEEGIKPKLADTLYNGEDDIPTFFGGTANHDEFYPEPSLSENRGQGTLTFDWYGMVERLEKAKKEFEEKK